MRTKTLPLKELSIFEIYNGDKATYEVPIYQRNYAWEKDEISALIQDVYDAYAAKKQTYFIGTLVSFHKGDQIYEVIDGQQRLTTLYLLLSFLEHDGTHPYDRHKGRLQYESRARASEALRRVGQASYRCLL